jgi:hypothetical protein
VRLYLKKKNITKVGLVEWLKVKALSSNPSTAKRKKKDSNLFLLEWLPPRTQTAINVGEVVGKKEPLYTAGGNVN